MAQISTKQDLIKNCLSHVSDIVKFPVEHMWIDYDREADVLYLSFRKPQRATKTIETDEDVLVRKGGNKIVGVTIRNAGSR